MIGQRLTAPEITRRKGAVPLVMLTAYTAPMASILDAHTDVLLVGDSLGMVVYGMDSTLSVTVDMMVAHGKAVVKATKRSLVVVDMPFGSYEASPEQAFATASRLMAETGCGAVKLEGGQAMAATVAFLTERSIPVMAHIGLMPQHVHRMGGYKYQGRTEQDITRLLAEGEAIQRAGAFAVVLEGITEKAAAKITASLTIPTIGIGASPSCDGQVLVIDDMLGMFEQTPRFVKQFGTIRTSIDDAVKAYKNAVTTRQFPGEGNWY